MFFLSVAADNGVGVRKCEKNVSEAAVGAGDCAQNAEQNQRRIFRDQPPGNLALLLLGKGQNQFADRREQKGERRTAHGAHKGNRQTQLRH